MYDIVENSVSYTIKTVGVIPLLQANILSEHRSDRTHLRVEDHVHPLFLTQTH